MAENLRGEDRDMGHMRVFDLGANKDFLGVVHAGRGFFCQHIDIGGKNVFLEHGGEVVLGEFGVNGDSCFFLHLSQQGSTAFCHGKNTYIGRRSLGRNAIFY